MVFSEENVARVSQLVSPVVSIDKAAMLERDVSAEEIKDTIFSMKTNKSPGTDGYTADFFKASWDVVGADVVVAIKSFF